MTRKPSRTLPRAAWEGERDVDQASRLMSPGRHVHMVGAGGVGMAGLARLLQARGLRVSGCDLASNRLTRWLADSGVAVARGHSPSHVSGDVAGLVRSTALPADHPEILEAVAMNLPVFLRGTVLAALVRERRSVAVSGTHGKTTTTSMTVQALRACGGNPGYCIGGESDLLGVAADGDGSLLVVEADESDATLELYEPDMAVVTNIEYDHMEHFGSRAAVEDCFARFAAQARKGVVYCADDPGARRVCGRLPGALSYGFSEAAEYRGRILRSAGDAPEIAVEQGGAETARIRLPVRGEQNARNALAVVAVGQALGWPVADIAAALGRFVPVDRRFQTICEGRGIRVISDYAHHPTELRHAIGMARQVPHKRLIGVFQPHRYTRTLALGREFPPAFEGLDELVLTPVYAASEKPLSGGTSDDLFAHFPQERRMRLRNAGSLEEAWQYLQSILEEGDVLLVLGAGDVECIGQWARAALSVER